MLLFGVGGAASADNNGTTLGRIGLGYFILISTTNFLDTSRYGCSNGNFGAKIGIFDPNDVAADTTGLSATDKHVI